MWWLDLIIGLTGLGSQLLIQKLVSHIYRSNFVAVVILKIISITFLLSHCHLLSVYQENESIRLTYPLLLIHIHKYKCNVIKQMHNFVCILEYGLHTYQSVNHLLKFVHSCITENRGREIEMIRLHLIVIISFIHTFTITEGICHNTPTNQDESHHRSSIAEGIFPTQQHVPKCTCNVSKPYELHVNCSGQELRKFPSNIPIDTTILDLVNNNITGINFTDIFRLKNLTELLLAGNPLTCDCELRWLYLALTTRIAYFEKLNITGAECMKQRNGNENGNGNGNIDEHGNGNENGNGNGNIDEHGNGNEKENGDGNVNENDNGHGNENENENGNGNENENENENIDNNGNGKENGNENRNGNGNVNGNQNRNDNGNKNNAMPIQNFEIKDFTCNGPSKMCYTCKNQHKFGECSINTEDCAMGKRCFTRISWIGNQYSVSKGCTDMPTTQCDDCKSSDDLFLPRNCTYVCGSSHCNAFLPSEFIQWNMCPHSITCYDNVDIQWRPTPAGEEAEVKCPFVSPRTGLMVTRKCDSDGIWEQPDTSLCTGVTITPATHQLDNLAKTTTNAQNAPGIAKKLSNLTSAAEYFAAVDVYLTVDVIDNLLNANYTNTTSIEVANNVLKSVDNLFNVERDVLVASQKNGQTASRLIKIIDQLAMAVETQNETREVETDNFVISIVNLNTSAYTGISFSVSDNDQNNFDNDYSSSELNTKSSIQLPSSLFDGHRFQDGSSRAQFISYKSNIFFKTVGAALSDDVNQTLNNVTSDYDINNDTIYGVLNSAVIGASIGDLIISDLGEPIKINLTWQRGNLVNPQCVYWDYSLNDDVGGWSTDGCNVSGQSSNNVTTCECDHLTNFALLMDVYGTASEFDEGHQKALSIVSYIGCGISLLCMLLTLITFLAFRRLRKDNPTKILMNLCFAIFMSLLLFLAVSFSVDFAPIIPELCTTMAVLLHYFLLAVMTWMALEAFNMYLLLVKIFKTYIRHFMIKLGLIGWGTPVVIVAITLVIDIDNYGYHNNICWLSRYAFFAAFLAPVCLVLIFNTVIYILVVHQICSLNSKNMSTSDRYGKAAQLRGSVSLFVLLGITWALAILAISEAGLIVNYLFAIANTLQGLFIFIFFCALKKDVQNQWRDTFCSSCCLRGSETTDSPSTSAKKYLPHGAEYLPQNRCYDNTASSHL